MTCLASVSVANQCTSKHSARSVPLNDSTYALSVGCRPRATRQVALSANLMRLIRRTDWSLPPSLSGAGTKRFTLAAVAR